MEVSENVLLVKSLELIVKLGEVVANHDFRVMIEWMLLIKKEVMRICDDCG